MLIGCLRAGTAVKSALHAFPGWFKVRTVHVNTPFNESRMTIYVCMYMLVAQSGLEKPILASFFKEKKLVMF